MENLLIYIRKILPLIDKTHNWTVTGLLKMLRRKIQFTPTPTNESMANGEFDCVGSSYCAMVIFGYIFPQDKFQVALINCYPWSQNIIGDSQHTILIRFLKDGDIQMIDPTPINGYGYGRVSQVFKRESWVCDGRSWSLSLDFKKRSHWGSYLYSSFHLLDTDQIKKILNVSQIKADFKKENYFFEIDLPDSSGWRRDYYRFIAKVKIQNHEYNLASEYLMKAMEATPLSPYVLRDILSNTNLCFTEECREIVSLRERGVVSDIVNTGRSAIDFWKQKQREARLANEDQVYIYYGGCIYWRERSLRILLGLPLAKDACVIYGHETVPVYRLTPAWFSSNGVKVVVSNNKIADAYYSKEYSINEESKIALRYCNMHIKDSKYVSIVDINIECEFINEFFFDEAHECLLSLVEPNLLIV